eukprot:2210-Heterococcus_DN1.PRE.3
MASLLAMRSLGLIHLLLENKFQRSSTPQALSMQALAFSTTVYIPIASLCMYTSSGTAKHGTAKCEMKGHLSKVHSEARRLSIVASMPQAAYVQYSC